MSPDILSPYLPHSTTDYFDSDTETLYDPDGSPYARAMKRSNINTARLTPERSPRVRQTRSSSANAAAAAAAASTPSTTHTNGTMTRNRGLSTSSSTKRKAVAANLSSINTDTPPPTTSRKRKRSVKDEIEVQLPNSRSRESSASTSISTLSTGRSSSSMPPPSSITPPFTSPLVSSKPTDKKINRTNQAGETPLHQAAAAGKLERVRDLLARGASVNVQCHAGWTPLHKACLKGFVPIVELLCASGAHPDIKSTDEHDTPLHDACANGHLRVVQILLQHGANPHLQNSEGWFPYEVVREGNDELEKLATEAYNTYKDKKEAAAHEDREDSEPPMSPATKRHSRRTSTASDNPLVPQTHLNGRPKRGAQSGKDDFLARDIKYRDKDRRGHLHLNALQGNNLFVRELLNIGANVKAPDRDGNTPLHLAARGGHYEVVKALLEYEAEVNALNHQNETPILEVAGRGHKDIVDLLLFYGADPTLKDSSGRTALDVAVEKFSTAAEGEIDALRAKCIELGVELPQRPENDDVDVKMEDVDEVPDLIKAVEYEPPEASDRDGTNDVESVVNDQPISSPPKSTPMERSPSPVINVSAEERIPQGHGSYTELKDPCPAPVGLAISATPMEEVIQQEPAPAPAPIAEVVPPTSSSQENADTEAEVPELPEVSAIASAPSPPKAAESSPTPSILQPVEEPVSIEIPQRELDPSTPDSTDQMAVDEVVEEEKPQEPEIEASLLEEPQAPSPSPPEPQWKKLAGLQSLNASLEKEITQLLPIYTMNLRNDMDSFVTFVAHFQICSLLGFTSSEFFEKYSDISKRALSKGEKSRFCTPFVTLVSHPLTFLKPPELESFMETDIQEFKGEEAGDLWYEFDKKCKCQFMAMSVYLIPLESVREIVARDFPALSDLVDRKVVRLDTSDLDGGDAEIVYDDSKADRYIDCWRRVAGKSASSKV